jgi:hypothetical protein
MRRYFYDRELDTLVAFNEETGQVVQLQSVGSIAAPVALSAVIETPAKRKYTRRVDKSSGKGKRTITCKKCGGQGHQAKTCKLTPTPEKEGERKIDKVAKLTETQFEDAKEQYSDGVSTLMIRMTMSDVDLDEIRRAVDCDTFEKYVGNR